MRIRTSGYSFMILAAALFLTTPAFGAETNRAHHVQFESSIREFEARDKTNPPPQNAVLLVGSSSIRKWTMAQAQFPNHKIINRGFGGSHLGDSVAFVDRIVIPYQPKLIFLYAGDNDLAAGIKPQQVFEAFKEFVAKVRAGVPDVTIAYLSIKPSPSREKFMPQCREANKLISEYIAGEKNLIYVDVFNPMLDANGKARGELFVSDRLHMNETGYKLWAEIVTPIVDKVDPQKK